MTLPRDQLSGLSLVRLAGAVVTSRGGFSGATVFLTFSIRVKTIFSLPFILIYVQVVDLTLVGGVCFLPQNFSQVALNGTKCRGQDTPCISRHRMH